MSPVVNTAAMDAVVSFVEAETETDETNTLFVFMMLIIEVK